MNLVIISGLIISMFLIIPLGLFFSDLFPISVAINKLLPLGTFGFICSMTTGGILVLTNLILIPAKLILNFSNKRLKEQLNKVNKLTETTKKTIEPKKDNKTKQSKSNEYNYKYQPTKNNTSTMVANNHQNGKVKSRTRSLN